MQLQSKFDPPAPALGTRLSPILRKANPTGLWAHYNSLSTLSPSAMMVSMDTDVRTQRRTLNYPGTTATRSSAEDVVLQVARPFRKLGVRYSVTYRDGM